MRQFTILKSFFPLIQMSFFFKLGDVFDKSCLPLIYNNTSIFVIYFDCPVYLLNNNLPLAKEQNTNI